MTKLDNNFSRIDLESIDFEKSGGLIPAVVQHYISGVVLMVGYMNKESLEVTLDKKMITFYSRSKKRLWTKGEESKNYLMLKDISVDCDKDTVLLLADPVGPTCHTGEESCFGDSIRPVLAYLQVLLKVIHERKQSSLTGYESNSKNSYTVELFRSGVGRIAQKVGEEGVEVALASIFEFNKDKFVGEAADLMFHLFVLLEEKGCGVNDVVECLMGRRGNPTQSHTPLKQ